MGFRRPKPQNPSYVRPTAGGRKKPLTQAQVNASYQKILGRNVDPSGASSYVGNKKITSTKQMEKILLESREYANKQNPRPRPRPSSSRTTTAPAPAPSRSGASGSLATPYTINGNLAEIRRMQAEAEARAAAEARRQSAIASTQGATTSGGSSRFAQGREVYESGVGNQPATVTAGRAQADSEAQVAARASDLADELRRNRERLRLQQMRSATM